MSIDAHTYAVFINFVFMDKVIKRLRVFFRISNAAFDFMDATAEAITARSPVPSKMRELHRLALIEIEKENPDLKAIDNLLAQMEHTAAAPKPNFPKGGIPN
jgi:hypothetical protein